MADDENGTESTESTESTENTGEESGGHGLRVRAARSC